MITDIFISLSNLQKTIGDIEEKYLPLRLRFTTTKGTPDALEQDQYVLCWPVGNRWVHSYKKLYRLECIQFKKMV